MYQTQHPNRYHWLIRICIASLVLVALFGFSKRAMAQVVPDPVVATPAPQSPAPQPPNPTKLMTKAPYIKGIHDGMGNELQPFKRRANYGRLLEPKDKVLHGIGQSHDAYQKYAGVMPTTAQPSVYMSYHGLKSLGNGDNLRKELKRISALPYPAIPQIGLSMTIDGKPELRYEHEVAEGKYDDQIRTFIAELKAFDRPVYLRLGYEFNGFWNGYQATPYVAAFRHVVDMIRAAKVPNVAIVWCFAVDSDQDEYMSFYPGDKYVDWWSIDVFSPWQFERPELWDFLDSARVHKYPVMVGECTPRRTSVSKGDTSWRKWFVPYFNMVRLYPNLKATCYINWNWGGTPWPDWGDARIEAAPIDLRKKYLYEISQPWYLHSDKKHAKFILGK